MNSTTTNSLNFSGFESPGSNSSSFFNESPMSDSSSSSSSSAWKRTRNRHFSYAFEEHGHIEDLEVSDPFVLKFHNISGGRVNGHQRVDVVCQLDDFSELPIADAAKCLDDMPDEQLFIDSVEIEIKLSAPSSITDARNVLQKFAERREKSRGSFVIKRLSFFIYDFTYAKDFAPILARIAPRACIINLGIPKRKVYALQPTEEARFVLSFLAELLLTRKTWETLRVLRIFYFVTLDSSLQRILKKCNGLRHLTLSNIDDVGLLELPSVQSVILDSANFSITMFDDLFADKHPRLFPNATTFGFLRCDVSLSIRALKQWSVHRISETRKEIHFYQPERDFRKFLYEATKSFEVVNDDRELEGEIQLRGHSGGPLITVFNKDRVYKTRLRNE